MKRIAFAVLLAVALRGDGQESPHIQKEIDKVERMPPEQARTYIHTSGTTRSLYALGLALEAYKIKHGSYPTVTSIAGLQRVLDPDLVAMMRTTDTWGNEFRYVPAANGKGYLLASAGNDGVFDEASWTKHGKLATADDDEVLQNGIFVRRWDDDTRPGLPAETRARMKLKPAARAALERADARNAANDSAGSLEAYMEAVRADAAAASLDRIREYAPPPSYALTEPLPPAEQRAADERFAKGEKAHVAALRQYLDLHPDDLEARTMLLPLIPLADAEAMLAPSFKRRPNDPELYEVRGGLRAKAGDFDASLADYAKAAELDPRNPERQYLAGVVSYETATKRAGLTPQQKRDVIARGIAYFESAEALKPDSFEAMMYHNVLLRQKAELESDPETKKKLIAEADAVRQRAIALIQRRKEQRATP